MNLRQAAEMALGALEHGGPAHRLSAMHALRAALAEADDRKCTCHPDDNPPQPCPKQFALGECRQATALTEAGEPIAWQCRTRPTWGRRHGLQERPWGPWEFCSKEVAEDCWRTPFLNDWAYEARALYTHPPRREPLAEEEVRRLYREAWTPESEADEVLAFAPVAWRWGYRSITTGQVEWMGVRTNNPKHDPDVVCEPLYAHPPRREPLTEEQIEGLIESYQLDLQPGDALKIWRAMVGAMRDE